MRGARPPRPARPAAPASDLAVAVAVLLGLVESAEAVLGEGVRLDSVDGARLSDEQAEALETFLTIPDPHNIPAITEYVSISVENIRTLTGQHEYTIAFAAARFVVSNLPYILSCLPITIVDNIIKACPPGFGMGSEKGEGRFGTKEVEDLKNDLAMANHSIAALTKLRKETDDANIQLSLERSSLKGQITSLLEQLKAKDAEIIRLGGKTILADANETREMNRIPETSVSRIKQPLQYRDSSMPEPKSNIPRPTIGRSSSAGSSVRRSFTTSSTRSTSGKGSRNQSFFGSSMEYGSDNRSVDDSNGDVDRKSSNSSSSKVFSVQNNKTKALSEENGRLRALNAKLSEDASTMKKKYEDEKRLLKRKLEDTETRLKGITKEYDEFRVDKVNSYKEELSRLESYYEKEIKSMSLQARVIKSTALKVLQKVAKVIARKIEDDDFVEENVVTPFNVLLEEIEGLFRDEQVSKFKSIYGNYEDSDGKKQEKKKRSGSSPKKQRAKDDSNYEVMEEKREEEQQQPFRRSTSNSRPKNTKPIQKNPHYAIQNTSSIIRQNQTRNLKEDMKLKSEERKLEKQREIEDAERRRKLLMTTSKDFSKKQSSNVSRQQRSKNKENSTGNTRSLVYNSNANKNAKFGTENRDSSGRNINKDREIATPSGKHLEDGNGHDEATFKAGFVAKKTIPRTPIHHEQMNKPQVTNDGEDELMSNEDESSNLIQDGTVKLKRKPKEKVNDKEIVEGNSVEKESYTSNKEENSYSRDDKNTSSESESKQGEDISPVIDSKHEEDSSGENNSKAEKKVKFNVSDSDSYSSNNQKEGSDSSSNNNEDHSNKDSDNDDDNDDDDDSNKGEDSGDTSDESSDMKESDSESGDRSSSKDEEIDPDEVVDKIPNNEESNELVPPDYQL